MKDHFLLPDSSNVKSNTACHSLIDPSKSNTGYIDLVGRFLKRSSCGNEYTLVGYHYDCNYIHYIPVKNRKGSSIATSWKELNNIFKSARVAPEVNVLDNETSNDLMDSFEG